MSASNGFLMRLGPVARPQGPADRTSKVIRGLSWVLLVAFALPACGAAQPCACPSASTCGLTLGEPVSHVRTPPPKNEIEYYFGLSAIGAGLAGVGIGGGYALAGSRHRDEAAGGGTNQNILLDKADANDERATVGIGVGVPLLLIGSVLLLMREEQPPPSKIELPPPGMLGGGAPPAEIRPGQGAAAAEQLHLPQPQPAQTTATP